MHFRSRLLRLKVIVPVPFSAIPSPSLCLTFFPHFLPLSFLHPVCTESVRTFPTALNSAGSSQSDPSGWTWRADAEWSCLFVPAVCQSAAATPVSLTRRLSVWDTLLKKSSFLGAGGDCYCLEIVPVAMDPLLPCAFLYWRTVGCSIARWGEGRRGIPIILRLPGEFITTTRWNKDWGWFIWLGCWRWRGNAAVWRAGVRVSMWASGG